ncbi:Membrane protein involved in the export of O-antigen and teichoic acid [Pedococcus cremeus]|uniref:Membrane protein involved in the export of O-antigen and teichoic acid n=1 Tax=Pedococcus cremeus TaxID=587636 RepID=A0A1H9XUS1_9MICO|nr:Membrane protein involved in the export of O-antigen and teichoic acid [Pedococcus cremeus]
MGAGVDQQVAEEGIGRSAASGVLWLAAQKWVVRVSGFATLVVLTRTVTPREFGVVAAAMTFVPMIYLLSDLGFSTYLLQTPQVDRRSLSTAFWTSVAAGALLSAGLWFVAPLVAEAFRIPDLVPVLRALVLSVVPTVLAGVPLALLRRSMRFRAVAVQALVAAVLAQTVAVVVALRGGGVWALVSQVVVAQWVIAVLAWRGARWVPSFWLSPRQFREMASFGLRVSSVDFVAMSRLWAESWIITVTLGPSALGLLNIGQRLVQVAQDLAAASLVPVSTVVFARVRQSNGRLLATYVKALGVAYSVVSPFMLLIVVTAPALVPLLFGEEWRASVAPAQALAVAGIITLGAMLDHGLFYGLGRPGSWLAYAVVVDAATVATTAVAVQFGLTGVAVGFVGVAAAATIARWVIVGRLLGLRTRVVARPFLTVLVPTTVTAAAGALVFRALEHASWPWLAVLLTAAVTVVVNVVMLRLLAASIVRDAVGIVPVPERYVSRVRRILRLEPVGAA